MLNGDTKTVNDINTLNDQDTKGAAFLFPGVLD